MCFSFGQEKVSRILNSIASGGKQSAVGTPAQIRGTQFRGHYVICVKFRRVDMIPCKFVQFISFKIQIDAFSFMIYKRGPY
jgi:hypothetical protein